MVDKRFTEQIVFASLCRQHASMEVTFGARKAPHRRRNCENETYRKGDRWRHIKFQYRKWNVSEYSLQLFSARSVHTESKSALEDVLGRQGIDSNNSLA